MPRPKNNSEEDGVLTIPLAAEILKISNPTLRKWFDRGCFKDSFRVPATRERRIPAPSIVSFLREKGMPVPNELDKYVAAFQERYGIKGSNKSDPRSAF